MQVLIASSDNNTLDMLHAFLRKKNFDIVTTHRPAAIFKLLRRFHPSVIILNTSGYAKHAKDLCKEIKRFQNSGNIQVLMVVDNEIQLGATQYECDDIITQPVVPSVMLEKLFLCQSGLC